LGGIVSAPPRKGEQLGRHIGAFLGRQRQRVAQKLLGAVVDLHGRIATPGLIDSHAHLTSMARLVSWIDLADP